MFLTPKAIGLLQEMRAVERVLNQNVLKGFSAEERHTLAELLGRVKANLSHVIDKSGLSEDRLDDD